MAVSRSRVQRSSGTKGREARCTIYVWLEKLYRCTTSELVEAVLLFHNLFREEPCALNQAIAFNCLEERITYDVRRNSKVQDFRGGQCKDYIFSHLHERIHTSDIAKALYLNANYLSGLFKKEEGITISAYILREKVKLAKTMLMYSRYSNIEIAGYLGFCSQSHLGAQFKKETGMTLHQYREQYGKREFINGRIDGG